MDQPVKKNFRKYDNIMQIATVLECYYTTGCLPADNYFNNNDYKMIAIDLSKQQTLDADPKSIHKAILQEIPPGKEMQIK